MFDQPVILGTGSHVKSFGLFSFACGFVTAMAIVFYFGSKKTP